MTEITLPPGVTGVPLSIAEAVKEYKYSAMDIGMLRDDDVALLVADPADRRGDSLSSAAPSEVLY